MNYSNKTAKTKGTFVTLPRAKTVSYNLAEMNTNCLHDGPGHYMTVIIPYVLPH